MEFSAMKTRELPISFRHGDRRHYTKSDLMGCVESLITASQNGMPENDAKIVDGSGVVYMLPLKASLTFGGIAAPAFIQYLIKLLQTPTRLDIV